MSPRWRTVGTERTKEKTWVRFRDLMRNIGIGRNQALLRPDPATTGFGLDRWRFCSPDRRETVTTGGLIPYLNALEDTEDGHIYVDHIEPRSEPAVPESIYFRGSAAEVPPVSITFSTQRSASSNVIPVVDVDVAETDAEVVNKIRFYNYTGVWLGDEEDRG